MVGKLERDHWHPGFIGAMELEFRENKNDLSFKDEYTLSKESLKMDLLIIKVEKGAKINNQIGEIFRQHNIFEYKSPDDGITIDDYYKTVGYAFLYKGLGPTVNAIPGEELTVSMVREAYPVKLFRMIAEGGGRVEKKHPGVYYVSGVVNIPTQVIVTKELDKAQHASLRVLTKRALPEDVITFLQMVGGFTEPGDKQNADAVLQLSVSANRQIYEDLKRRDPAMCEALRELMKEEIEERFNEGKLIAYAEMIDKGLISYEQAAQAVDMTVEQFKTAVEKLKVIA